MSGKIWKEIFCILTIESSFFAIEPMQFKSSKLSAMSNNATLSHWFTTQTKGLAKWVSLVTAGLHAGVSPPER